LGQVVSQSELILYRGGWKRNGGGVVCVCGAFDLLHPGHTRLLEQARSLGDVLVVAVQSDASVRALRDLVDRPQKSPQRPIVPVAERMEILAALAAVDYVVAYDEPTPASFVGRLNPDVLVEGSGENPHLTIGQSRGKEAGMKIVRIPLEPGYSTSRLIERITELRA
jgi:rfaE bifunctional protein nucleotidyltransferase chain/domain